MVSALTAAERPLKKVFSSDYDFAIPDYQRAYRWKADQALQLLDDLEEALDRSGDEPYFLGSLVLVERPDTGFDVIDGQQRLTTLTILFAILRDLAEKPANHLSLAGMVLEPGNELDDLPSKPRLGLRGQERAFFEKYVQNPGQIESLIGLTDASADSEPRRAIRDNAAALRKRLADWDDGRRSELASLMRNRTYLVTVSTPDIHSAYRIFSVMNARGLDLTPADIFKSTVIGSLAQGTDYAQRWENAEEALGSDDFTELFRDIRTIVSGDRARLELLREFPAQVLDTYLESGHGAAFVDQVLLPYAKAFERTVGCDLGPGAEWKPVNDHLRRLGMIDNKDWRAPALWAMVHHPDDPAFLAAFLRKLERLAAAFLLRGDYTTPRVGRYLDLLRQLKDGQGLASGALELGPDEKQGALAALNGEIYWMQAKRARFVMLRLDELLANDPGATYNHNVITIEHVLPQTPADDSQWRRDFTDEERATWTHRLGNLLLLNRRKNSQAQNFDFATKKSKYFTSSSGSAVFALTTQVLQHDAWTPEVVEERQAQLVGLLAKEWELT